MITVLGYEIQEKIRHNHNIDTYHALRLKDKRKVTLKIPNNHETSSENLALLQHEYNLLNKFEIPNIIKAYDFMHNTPAPVLILEDVPGQLLSDYLAVNQLEIGDFFDLALQLVDIVGELHEQNIIHKEIKPDNIVIDPEKLSLKLVDLSASTRLSEEQSEVHNLKDFIHDLAYISPEQTGRINRMVDYRTDFYSLGITLYQMLTGHIPFQSNDPKELVYYHIAKKPPSVLTERRNIPKMLAAIIEKLLEKLPEDRYSSIVGIKTDLQECNKQWLIKKNVSEYSLGLSDIQDHLSMSRNLYGREPHVHQLLDAFNQVSRGAKKIIFVAGYSGIGKTSLVREVYKPIVEHHGYYIQGKFDQLQRGRPYSAIVAAFQNLVQQILAESKEHLELLKKQLMYSLGNVAQVVIDVIPEVELIIGPQPPVRVLNPSESQIRFNLVFQNFVRVFAQSEHPLVIFLDDLQWADNSSLNFIENLLQDRETKYLLIIGAYRDNEVNEHHPLQLSINNLQKHKVECTTLTLQPLQLKDIQQLLSDAMHGTEDKISLLAECVRDKTHGNPFFINEFLKMIYQDNLLVFNYQENAWEWNLEQIEHNTTDNVLHLLRAKIQLLSQPTQDLLKLASCIGHQFDFKTLLIISGQAPNQTAEQLWQAISSTLMSPQEEAYKTLGLVGITEPLTDLNINNLHYKFAHDRIQQATYDLIKEEDKASIHLKIGRLLLKEKPLEEQEERLFVVLKHFNQSIALVDDIEERYALAKYNYWASQKAKQASAYYAANEHLTAALAFLEPHNWKKNYNLSFQIYKEFAVCKYLIGDFNTADQYFSELLTHSRSDLDNLEVYRLKIEMLSTLGKHNEALEIGLAALKNFKINIPQKPNTLHLLIAIYKIKFQLRKTKIEEINLPPMVNLQQKAIVDLITQLYNSAFITNQKLFVLLACKNMSLSLQYGYTDSTSMCIPVYAFVIMHSLNLYDEAISFVRLYHRLKQEYGASTFEGKNQFVLGTFIEPYQMPFPECNQTVNNAFRLCCDVGDLVYGNYSKLLLVLHAFSAGKNLSEVKKNVHSVLSFMTRVNISDFLNVAKFWEYAIQCLENPKLVKLEQAVFFEENIIKGQSKTELSFFYSTLTRLHFLLDNYAEAVEAGEKHELCSDYDKGLISHLDGAFFYALALFHLLPDASKKQRALYLKKLKGIQSFIKKYATWCPENYKSYSLLIDCEFARLAHHDDPALSCYEQTIECALNSGLVLIAAIACERAGQHCIDIRLDRIAKIYLRNADRYYKEWGASTKVNLLEQNKLNLNKHTAPNRAIEEQQRPVLGTKNLDMVSMLHFTQQISNEIRIDKLLQKFLAIVLEITGGERGIIFLRVDDQWLVEVEGDVEPDEVYINGLVVSENPEKYPISMLQYVQNTLEPITLSDPVHSELTHEDHYLQHHQPKSLLMMPLFYQGQLSRAVYIEHTVQSDSFTISHLSALQMLATHAMNSLENAKRFYHVTHDMLTGLANRNMLYEIFQFTTKQISRSQGEIALLFLEVDSLKEINETYGKDVGDLVLKHVAKTCTANLREGDFIARIGGNEFTIMLTNTTAHTQLSVILERLFVLLAKPFEMGETIIHNDISIGIVLFPQDGNEIQKLLQSAEIANNQAKEKGKNQYHYYVKQDISP